jgi:hypothetical protein
MKVRIPRVQRIYHSVIIATVIAKKRATLASVTQDAKETKIQDRDFGILRSRSPGSTQISQLIGVASDLSVHLMGDKSPKSKNKQAVQKQAKAEVESQKKKDAVSAKQITKTKK